MRWDFTGSTSLSCILYLSYSDILVKIGDYTTPPVCGAFRCGKPHWNFAKIFWYQEARSIVRQCLHDPALAILVELRVVMNRPTDQHTTTAYTALAQHRAIKIDSIQTLGQVPKGYSPCNSHCMAPLAETQTTEA